MQASGKVLTTSLFCILCELVTIDRLQSSRWKGAALLADKLSWYPPGSKRAIRKYIWLKAAVTSILSDIAWGSLWMQLQQTKKFKNLKNLRLGFRRTGKIPFKCVMPSVWTSHKQDTFAHVPTLYWRLNRNWGIQLTTAKATLIGGRQRKQDKEMLRESSPILSSPAKDPWLNRGFSFFFPGRICCLVPVTKKEQPKWSRAEPEWGCVLDAAECPCYVVPQLFSRLAFFVSKYTTLCFKWFLRGNTSPI